MSTAKTTTDVSEGASEANESASEEATPAELGELQLGVAANDLRWAVVDVRGPLEEMRRSLDLSPIAAVALGRALASAALLLRFTTKAPSRLVLEVAGDGPLGKILAEVDYRGRMRGQVGAPQLETPEDGSLSIARAVGEGTLKVTQESERGRYQSQVALVSGEIGQDLVHFLEQSQQIHSAALVGVLPRPTGIEAAGGLLVEAFPGIGEETVSQLETNIRELAGVSAYLADGGLPRLRDAVLAGFEREDLEHYPLVYSCGCRRDNLLARMREMATEDVDALADADGRIEAVCGFCGSRYQLDREELRIH